MVCLRLMHSAYVGESGCLPALLDDYAAMHSSGPFNFTNDQILQIYIAPELSDKKTRQLLVSESSTGNSSSWNSTVPSNSTFNGSRVPDFEFATSWAVLALSKDVREKHRFEVVNITMPVSCFGNPLQRFILPLGGVGTVVANNIMHSIPTGGIMKAVSSREYYSWKASEISRKKTLGDWAAGKLMIVVASLFAFFILSTTTAVLVRVLISSGVVLLFPVFWLLQLGGVNIFNTRIISLSYPWLGVPFELLRSRHQSTIPFVVSHVTRVLIYYFMYEAAQIACSMWLYGTKDPGPKELWLFAVMMILEYFSMIYIRCSPAIQLFPRAVLSLFLLYHIYLYSFPLGFHLFALFVFFLFLSWLMIFTVRKLEYPAFIRGEISLEQPRALYNTVPWPTWTVALAPDFTIFMPVTHRSRSIYDDGDEDNNGRLPTPVVPIIFAPFLSRYQTRLDRQQHGPNGSGDSESGSSRDGQDDEDESEEEKVELISNPRLSSIANRILQRAQGRQSYTLIPGESYQSTRTPNRQDTALSDDIEMGEEVVDS
eukprot:CAMPEP_0185035770 /NCGR_PEP_ID=MMETSP1103-20130426/27735_1 /TAXON_ID=36769 /ORGANISM="Paraphysomonas bandaiensis, Strain Caron Lab Isolate" /LENGTH=540 /DNA_ID=CAMNT_0027573017 /DNA_START=206 /DNA_END=1826 /DNA_ORIENTATION=-